MYLKYIIIIRKITQLKSNEKKANFFNIKICMTAYEKLFRNKYKRDTNL